MRFSLTTNTCVVLLALLPPLMHAMPMNSNSIVIPSSHKDREVGIILLQPRDYRNQAVRDAAYSFASSNDKNCGGRHPGFIGSHTIDIEEDHDLPITTEFESPFDGPLMAFRYKYDIVADNLPHKQDVYEVWVASTPDGIYQCAMRLIASGGTQPEYRRSSTRERFYPVKELKEPPPAYAESEATAHAGN
ncbi:hypothetical protein FB446DRAFT_731326 [Lentinula raphanica]|nr:hypothetical protein FB446DRAFT_731326 [Lentinula raphanica]